MAGEAAKYKNRLDVLKFVHHTLSVPLVLRGAGI
jgi:hypothetical protein